MLGRRKVAALAAEFLGTGILTLLVLSVQRSTIGIPFFVALAAGMTLVVTTFAFGRSSGAHFNPALTFALWTARKVSSLTAAAYIVVQLLGGWLAFYLYAYFVNSQGQLQPVGGKFNWHLLVAEAVGTAIFTLGWTSALYQRFSNGASAAVAGVSYVVGVIGASAAAIGLLNPALALGIRAWSPLDGWATWGTYLAGPLVGALLGVNLYSLLFASPVEEVATPRAKGATAASPLAPGVVEIAEEEAERATTARKPARRSRAAATRGARSTAKRTSAKRPARRTAR